MRALYDDAIAEGERLDLRPGVALTPEQIAALQEDILWLETVVINGREVLIPRVYLAPQEGIFLSIAVGQIVGGLNFIQSIESAFWQSAAKAGLSSAITQSVAGVVSGEFDLGEILEGAAFARLVEGGLDAVISSDLFSAAYGTDFTDSFSRVPRRACSRRFTRAA
jgi:hypothetical protein